MLFIVIIRRGPMQDSTGCLFQTKAMRNRKEMVYYANRTFIKAVKHIYIIIRQLSSTNHLILPWRNWLARPTVNNRSSGGSQFKPVWERIKILSFLARLSIKAFVVRFFFLCVCLVLSF
jgi:hypothetical protein